MSFSHSRNLITQNFVHFENKKCNYKISGPMWIVELFTLYLLVYFIFLIERSNWWKNAMQSTAIHYVQPITFYSFLYVFIFHLFSNISKTVFKSSHIWFCREFQAPSFDKKRYFNHKDNRGEILKILRGRLFMAHPLYRTFTTLFRVQLTGLNTAFRCRSFAILLP
jgi:hypothetical protein